MFNLGQRSKCMLCTRRRDKHWRVCASDLKDLKPSFILHQDSASGQLEPLSPRKVSSHNTALHSFFFLPPSYVPCFRVSMPPALRSTLLRQMDIGVFKVCTNMDACRTHEGGGGGGAGGGGGSDTNKSAQDRAHSEG